MVGERGYPSISLFSGVGGLDLGLSRAGFKPYVFLDKDPDCCKSLELNREKYWKECKRIIEGKIEDCEVLDILKIAGYNKGEIALVFGGPPCQPFSKSAFWSPNRWSDGKPIRPENGKSRSVKSFKGLEDPRAGLINEFVAIVREAQPVAYLIENVRGLSYKTSKPMLDSVLESLKEAGYTTNPEVLNAVEYGVPQKRERLFIIGTREGVKLEFPKPTHFSKKKPDCYATGGKPFVTAGMAISDLDRDYEDDELKVEGKWGHLLPEIPPGDNYLFFTEKRGHPNPIFVWRSKYWSFLLKLSPDKPSWTIQAQPGPYVGPFHWKNRRLTVAEIKRLQTFPDDYIVSGNRKAAQRQLGDAVPPLLAEMIGESIKDQLIEANLI